MKLNATTLKVIAAAVVIMGVIFWGITSMSSKSFSGANLTFNTEAGSIAVTNPSDTPVNAQIVGTGSRGFAVQSSIEGLGGSSVKQGTGAATTQLLDITLPPGTSEFTVVRGNNVQFVSTSPTVLQATVQAMSSDSVRSTLIIMGVVVLLALFFMSYTTDHAWVNMLRGKTAVPAYVPIAITDTAQGQAIRGFGDNRKRD